MSSLVRLPCASLLAALALLAAPRAAHAFCRTTTCDPPADFVPSGNTCEPSGWSSTCASQGLVDVPLWWSTSCPSYDVQANASKMVTFAQADMAWTAAFDTWSAATCSDGSHPSIQGTDLGSVTCDQIGYQTDAANQHVLVFRDDEWPYQTAAERAADQKSLTIALTTVNFDRNTGEIFDADIEINSGQHTVIVTSAPAQDTFDLQAVLTHETGHFLGLAHSPDTAAVMFAQDEGSDTKKRNLASDDVSAICAVYPTGERNVGKSVSSSGQVPAGACDPTPRHGFSSACATPQPSSKGCAASPREVPFSSASGLLLFAAGLGAAATRRARLRRCP